MQTWLPRNSQISMIELFAPVLILHLLRDTLRGKKVLVFMDSESALGALVKGDSSREDISELAGVFWQLAARMETSIYLDRVSTDSNPADGPSRPDKAHTYQHLKWLRVKGAWRQLLVSDHIRAWEINPEAGTCM